MDYRTNHMVHGDVDIVTLVPVPVTSSTVDGVALRPFASTHREHYSTPAGSDDSSIRDDSWFDLVMGRGEPMPMRSFRTPWPELPANRPTATSGFPRDLPRASIRLSHLRVRVGLG
jgi:hypothetical protein